MVDERDKSVGPSIFSGKGAAAPSPDGKTDLPRREPKEPTEILKKSTDNQQVNGLFGLIKRANPVLIQPPQPPQMPQPPQPPQPSPQPVQSGDFGYSHEFKKPQVADENPLSEIENKSISPRRQLTVRIDVEKFKRLDRLGKLSGQTYQDIQSRALDAYLKDIDD